VVPDPANAGLVIDEERPQAPETKGLTQEELAFAAEIDLIYVGGIERGKRNPSLLVLARIADALFGLTQPTDIKVSLVPILG